MDGGGHKREPELDRLSNILKDFNDQFGNIPWTDADRVRKLITEEIPQRVAANTAYQNARKYSDKQNARDLAAKATEIEDAVYDLKAVNPHKKPVVDTRTPEELLDIIEAKGREVAEALAGLRCQSTSEAES